MSTPERVLIESLDSFVISSAARNLSYLHEHAQRSSKKLKKDFSDS